jgi:hypothetical protein
MADPILLALLDEEELHCLPQSGQFDTNAVANRIATLGFSFQDQTDPTMFVVAASAGARDAFQEARHTNPDGGFPYVPLIKVTPDQITLVPINDEDYADLSADFLAWLLATQPCRLYNDEGTNLTPNPYPQT